jgi:hypothetical protein
MTFLRAKSKWITISCLVTLLSFNTTQVYANSGWFQFDGLSARFKSLFSSKIDENTSKYAEQIGKHTSKFVENKINDIFYADPDGGYVRVNGAIHPVYYPRSQLVDNLFRKATGSTLTSHIRTLPPGVSHVTDFVRQKVEAIVVQKLIAELAGWSVEAIVTRSVLLSYGWGASKVDAYIQDRFRNSEATTQELVNNLQQYVNEQEVRTAANEILSLAQVEASNRSFADDISLSDVINYYYSQIVDSINKQARNFVIEGIAQASKTVAVASVNQGFDVALATQLATTTLTGAIGAIPASLVSVGLAGLTALARDPMKIFAGDRAYSTGKAIAERNIRFDLLNPKYKNIYSRIEHFSPTDDAFQDGELSISESELNDSDAIVVRDGAIISENSTSMSDSQGFYETNSDMASFLPDEASQSVDLDSEDIGDNFVVVEEKKATFKNWARQLPPVKCARNVCRNIGRFGNAVWAKLTDLVRADQAAVKEWMNSGDLSNSSSYDSMNNSMNNSMTSSRDLDYIH